MMRECGWRKCKMYQFILMESTNVGGRIKSSSI
jgi:hypothetical protein